MRRRPRSSERPSGQRERTRLVIGAVAILLGAAVLWIAYRANTGLPWQGRYEITAEVPDANRLIKGADVRIAGVRVGQVLSATAEPAGDGHGPYAALELALDQSVAPLPVDTTVEVRPASVLGLTFVDLRPGTSDATVPPGGTLPLGQARRTVDLTDLFEAFGQGQKRSIRAVLEGLGDGFAGRGSALNSTLGASARMLPAAARVARTLASPVAHLRDFLRGYRMFSGALAPVAEPLAEAFAAAEQTFGAFDRARAALAAAIELAPSSERATTVAFNRVQPALAGLDRLMRDLRPAGPLLPGSLSEINRTLARGVRPLRLAPRFAHRLRPALAALRRLARDPTTNDALRKLGDLVRPTNTVMGVLGPEQVDCNMIALWGIGFSSTFSGLGVGQGPALPNLVLTTGGAQGESLQNATPSPNVGINPLPHENARECEAGNEPWTGQQELNNPPGLQSTQTRKTAPPPGVRALAAAAGLLTNPPGTR